MCKRNCVTSHKFFFLVNIKNINITKFKVKKKGVITNLNKSFLFYLQHCIALCSKAKMF